MGAIPEFPAAQSNRFMKYIVCFFFCSLALAAQAQPATEIFLFDLKIRKGNVMLENPVNITSHPGYDNQPSFHPSLPLVYYSSARDDGRTDIFAFNWRNGRTMQITKTQEREYSPQITPDKKYISCIIQRDNNKQDLGQYPTEGGEAQVLINWLTVGYHAWMNPETLAVFVLGAPQTLRVVNPGSGKDRIVAENIGRSIHRIPGTEAISFVDKSDPERFLVRRINQDLSISDIGPAMSRNEDICWLPDGRILSSDGTQLWVFDTTTRIWSKIAGSVLNGVTRLAVSPDGKKLAVVAAE